MESKFIFNIKLSTLVQSTPYEAETLTEGMLVLQYEK